MRYQRSSPLHLYIHIPYCLHKCHYCDFNSHENSSPPWDDYQAALIAELEHHARSAAFAGRRLDTLFFGGGTPSLAPPALIEAVILSAERYFGLDEQVEITLEANPGTADSGHFEEYHRAGVNRLSMGVQSMQDQELLWLERIHNCCEVLQAFDMARAAGFTNINLDLMYGLPDQALDGWLQTLQSAIALNPEHISCYQLSVEPHTRLAARHSKEPYPLPDDGQALDFFKLTRQMLAKAGYPAYEISNFAKPGRECRHNDGYWLYHDYIGLGAGASGKWDCLEGGIRRYCNIRSPERYVRAALDHSSCIHSQEELDMHRAAAEAVWLGLRRSDGIDRSCFQKRFDEDAWAIFSDDLGQWERAGKLAISNSHVRLTEKGLPLADAIAASVL